MTIEGLVPVASDAGYAETIKRLDKALADRGILPILRLDHAAAAASVGLSLRPLLLLLIGDPRVGTRLMQANPTAGIDLPLRLLVWESEQGETWLGYADPAWIQARHGIGDVPDVVGRMATTLCDLALVAAGTRRS
ncbi:DUF302 domain-containing protein [Novosphingobium sp.]|uniref:DUF302 domain-containing protein n=1 Tax=Novosphingobium sp. TaxID=1874826 RepID=UPI003BA8B72E